ncbi:homeodomain-interacting protein kinase 1-like [Scomber scombrus]|nr:homeodomain-interacting protein kinase 1-like [Scomber scombrus]
MENINLNEVEGKLFSSGSSDYRAQKYLGCGVYGEVLQCRNLTSNEIVALKFIKDNEYIDEAKHEIQIFKEIQALNSCKFNIVKWIDSFMYEGLYCLELEKLDINLHEFVRKRPSKSLSLKEIRPILQQLSTALKFLSNVGIIHADLKPDNIMLVDHLRQPLRVKVIDFGFAFPASVARRGATLQAQWYRSPEILLGAPFNQAIDTWSLGCIAAELFMGQALFPGKDDYDMMRHMVYTVGKPPDDLLTAGLLTMMYFNAKYGGQHGVYWKFKHKTLDELSGEDAEADQSDRASFVDLLTKMLKVNVSERIRPSQILHHDFITMSHLRGFKDSMHVKSCSDLMSICQSCANDGTSNCPASPAQRSAPIEGHPAELSSERQTQSADTSGGSSQVKKRKRDGADKSADCGRTPYPSPPKEGGKGLLTPYPSCTKSPTQKRKRDDTDLCSPAKRICVTVDKELTDSVKNSKPSNSENGPGSTPKVSPLKRKRDEEESGSGNSSPDRKRREILAEGEKGANPDSENVQSNTVRVSPQNKRKRDIKEEPGSCKTSPKKKMRENLAGGEERTTTPKTAAMHPAS